MAGLLKTFFFLFLSTKLICQNITGEWIGQIYLLDKNGKYSILFPIHFEIKHDSSTNIISGTNTTKSFDTVVVDCKIEGEYNPIKSLFTILETKVLSSNNPKALNLPVLNRFKVTYQREEENLSGTCECVNPVVNPLCYQKLKVILKRYKEMK
jgi:hypothetical protein